MANKLLLDYSNITGEEPSRTLSGGELALNTLNKKIWVGNGSANILIYDQATAYANTGDTTYTAGTNMSLSGTTFSSSYVNTTYTAGTNMSLSGTTFSSSYVNTTYTAGTNMSLSGTTFSSTDTNTQLSTGAVRGKISASGNSQYNASTGVITSTNSTYTLAGLGGVTSAYVATQIANLVDSSPAALNTLNELAAAIGDDANYATTVTNALAGKDNYGSWAIKANSAAATNVNSGNTVAFIQGGATTVSRSGNNITIASTDTNTNTTYSAGTNMSLSGTTFSSSYTDTNTHRSISDSVSSTSSSVGASSQAAKSAYDRSWPNTWRPVRAIEAGGNTLTDTETLEFKAGTNVSISETGGEVTITSTDTNTNTTYSAGTNMSLSGTTFSSSYVNTTYSAGTNMSLSGTTFSSTDTNTHRSISDSVSSTSSSVGASSQAAKSAYDRSWPNTWRSISDSINTTSNSVSASQTAVKSAYDRSWPNTTYSAGTNMSLSGTTFSSTDTNTHRSISDSVSSTSSSVGASSQAAKSAYDRSWPNTTYSAGTGMTLSGTTFNCSITNNNQLTNGNSYLTTSGKAADSNLLDGIDSTVFNRGDGSYGVMVGTSGWNMNDVFTTRNRAGFFDAWSGTNFPSGTTHVQGMQTRHSHAAHYGWQLAGQYNQDGKLFVRMVSNNSWYSWRQIWTSNTLTNNNQLTNGASYITASGNTWRSVSDSVSSTSSSVGASSQAAKTAYDRSWPNTTYSAGTNMSLSGTTFSSTDTNTHRSISDSVSSTSSSVGASSQAAKTAYDRSWPNTWRGISNSVTTVDGATSASSTAVKTAYDRSWPNTTYSAGTNMSLSGTTFSSTDTNTHRSISDSVSSTSSTVGASSQAAKSAYDRSWPNTTYSAGSGMSLSGTTFTCTVTDTNTHRSISNSVTSTSSTVGASSQAAKTAYDRSWPNTTYSAGTGMSLSGTTFTCTVTDTNTHRSISDSVSSTSSSVGASSQAAKSAYDRSWPNTTYSAGTNMSLSGTTFSSTDTNTWRGLGNSSTTAHRGDHGSTAYDHTNGFAPNGRRHLPANGSAGQFLGYLSAGNAQWVSNPNSNTTYSASTGLYMSGTDIRHSDTSSQATSNNSGQVFIQDITLDGYGHVTAIGTATASGGGGSVTWNDLGNISALASLP